MYKTCQFEPCLFLVFDGASTDLIVYTQEEIVKAKPVSSPLLPMPERVKRMLCLADPEYYDSVRCFFEEQPLMQLRYGGTLEVASDMGVYTVVAKYIDAHPQLEWETIYRRVMTHTLKELKLEGFR
jgi:hypothetical protein